MSEADDHSQRFLPKIRQELDKLPLKEEEKENALIPLFRAATFLDTRGGQITGGGLRVDSPFFAFADKVTAVVTHFEHHGLTFADYLQAASQQPQLFYQSPAAIIGNVEGLVAHLAPTGLSTSDYLAAAVQAPSLFCTSPRTIATNIEGVVTHFADQGLTTYAYVQTALRQPSLFTRSPSAIAANIEGVVAHFAAEGLSITDYLAAARREPPLFYLLPATIARNIEGLVERFAADGLTTRQYLQAALKQPSLFYRCADSIAANIEGVVSRFTADGMTRRAYLSTALRHAQLFYQAPETISRHIETVIDFADRGIFTPPIRRRNTAQRLGPADNPVHASVLEFLLSHPALMSLADDNYGLREVHQRLTDGSRDAALLKRARRDVEAELMQHLAHGDQRLPVPNDGFVAGQAAPTEEQAKRLVLRALIHAGFIRSGTLER